MFPTGFKPPYGPQSIFNLEQTKFPSAVRLPDTSRKARVNLILRYVYDEAGQEAFFDVGLLIHLSFYLLLPSIG
jgi:hypothetical protein